MNEERITLESPDQPVELRQDARPRVPEPIPVRLVAVADVTLPVTMGLGPALEAFYVGLLRFEKEEGAEAPVYRAENFALRFEAQRPPVERDGYRAVGIEVLSLRAAEQKLIDAEIEYVRQRGLLPGTDSLVLLDPAGNQVELIESRGIM